MFLMCAWLGSQAAAATVSLTPSDAIIDAAGGMVSLEIVLDFADVGGALGGGFDINWDPGFLGLASITSYGLGDPDFERLPEMAPGILSSWGVGDFNSIQTGVVGRITLELLPGASGTTEVVIGPTNGIAGPWISAVDFGSTVQPIYTGTTITANAVPLPGAAWLLLSSFAPLLCVHRRRSG